MSILAKLSITILQLVCAPFVDVVGLVEAGCPLVGVEALDQGGVVLPVHCNIRRLVQEIQPTHPQIALYAEKHTESSRMQTCILYSTDYNNT